MILISEFIDKEALHWLEQRTICIYEPELYREPRRIVAIAKNAQGIIVRNRTLVLSELLDSAPHLSVVGRLGVGLDNLDCKALGRKRISTVYAPGSSARSVAEFCLMLILAQAKKLLQADTSVRAGLWERVRLTGQELYGKTVGIIGLGAVGAHLARMCSAMGCRVVVCSPRAKACYELVDLHTLLKQADFVSLNIPLTPDTYGMIGREELSLMQPHAYLINSSRGEVVDEDALYTCLKSQQIAGAALDVRISEPPKPNDRFSELDNVILSPHLAGLTLEAQSAVCQTVVEDVWRVLQGEQPLYPVPGLNFVNTMSKASPL